MTANLKAQIAALTAELTAHVGEKQAAHSVWMIEHCLGTEGLKRDGKAWLTKVRNSLARRLNEPTVRRVSQISEETLAWGGFLSDSVSYVQGPSLREIAKRGVA